MTRRAYGTERCAGSGFATLERRDGGQAGAGSVEDGGPRSTGQRRVRIEPPATGGADRLDTVDVAQRVRPFEVLLCRRLRIEGNQGVGDTGLLGALQHRLQAFRALRMVGSREMFEV